MADIPQVLATYDALVGVALGAGLTYGFGALNRRRQEALALGQQQAGGRCRRPHPAAPAGPLVRDAPGCRPHSNPPDITVYFRLWQFPVIRGGRRQAHRAKLWRTAMADRLP
jgi:hypothetical protein